RLETISTPGTRPLLATAQQDETFSLKQSRKCLVIGHRRSPNDHAISGIPIRIAGKPAAAAPDARAETHEDSLAGTAEKIRYRRVGNEYFGLEQLHCRTALSALLHFQALGLPRAGNGLRSLISSSVSSVDRVPVQASKSQCSPRSVGS